MKIKHIFYPLLCIIAGALNYILFRSDVAFLKPLRFKQDSIIVLDKTSIFGQFLLYNLSDILWALAILLFVSMQQQRSIRICGLLLPPMMEIAQAFDTIPGTFDFVDLTIYITISILFCIQWKSKRRTQHSLASSDSAPSC